MTSKLHWSSIVELFRLASFVVFVTALLSLAACGASSPGAVTPAPVATRPPSTPAEEATIAPPMTSTVAIGVVATATPLAVASPTSPAPPTASPTPATPIEVTAEMLNQQWGRAEGVAMVGRVAYTAIGPRLVALDAADPTALTPLGQSAPLPGLIGAVVARDGLVYVGAGSSVVALDVAAPATIVVLGQLDLDGVVT